MVGVLDLFFTRGAFALVSVRHVRFLTMVHHIWALLDLFLLLVLSFHRVRLALRLVLLV